MFFAWDQRYELGIESLDIQHQQLVALLNELYQAFREDRGREAMDGLLLELEDYAGHHFSHEEQMMANMSHGKAWQRRHLDEHEAFRRRIAAVRADHEAGADVTLGLLNYLKQWLSQHILVTDRGLNQ